MSTLPANRSVPAARVIPVLAYPDVRKAAEWLCDVFGFTERLQIAAHRAQLIVGDGGAVIVCEYVDRERRPQVGVDHVGHSVMVRIDDVRAHHERTAARGAEILSAPTEHVFGELQYVVKDPGGHRWTFSQTLADVHPNEWGDADVVLKDAR